MYKIIDLEVKGGDSGSLISLEQNKNIPFDIKRVYYIFDTKLGVTRGFHAHKKLKQVIICVSGSCEIMLDNGFDKVNIILNDPSKGILIESKIWREISNFSKDCVIVVVTDALYDKDDYIRNYEDFLKIVRR